MTDPLKPLFEGIPSGLERLVREAAASRSLTGRVRAALPENLRPHLLAAVRREADLVLIVDSAAWATRVRYAGRTLVETLNAAGGPAVGKVRVKVRPGGGGQE